MSKLTLGEKEVLLELINEAVQTSTSLHGLTWGCLQLGTEPDKHILKVMQTNEDFANKALTDYIDKL